LQVLISDEEFTTQVARSFPALWVYVTVAVTMLEGTVKEKYIVYVAGATGKVGSLEGILLATISSL